MSGTEQQRADEITLADGEITLEYALKVIEELKEDKYTLTSTLRRTEKSLDKVEASNTELTTSITELQETVKRLETGVTCKESKFSLDVMFEELDTRYIKYLNENLPPDMLQILSDHGIKLTTWSMIGAGSIDEYLNKGYLKMLRKHFEHDTKDLDDDDPAKQSLAAQYKVTLSQIKAISDKYATESADALKKVKAAKKAALQNGDKAAMAQAKDTEMLIREGLLKYVAKTSEILGAANEKIRSKGETVPSNMIKQYDLYIAFNKHFRGAKGSYNRIYGYGGMFIVYIYSDGMNISDVDVDVVISYRDAAVKIRKIRRTTVDSHISDITSLARFLIADQENKNRCKYLPPLGEIPTYKAPASEADLEKAAFKLVVSRTKAKVVTVTGGVATLYKKLHIQKASHIPVLKRNIPLTEICMRISRESGFRYTFLQMIRWGHFAISKEDAISTGWGKMYQLNLVSTQEEKDAGVISLKRTTAGHKELPGKDFIRISKKLRDQLTDYRAANPDIEDTDYVFSYYDLSNLPRTPKNVVKLLPIKTWRLILSKLGTIAGGVAAVLPMTFRNSYYTLMFAAANGDFKGSFKEWTGDDVGTANTFYKANSKTITLPTAFESKLDYDAIVAYIFNNE